MSTYLSMHRITSTVLEPVEHVPKGTTPEHWLRRLTLTDDEGAILELTLFSQTPDGLLTEADRVQAAARSRVETYQPIAQSRLNGVRDAVIGRVTPEEAEEIQQAMILHDLERDNDGRALKAEYLIPGYEEFGGESGHE